MSSEAIGTHVLLEFWGATRLDDGPFLEGAMSEAAREAGFHVLRTVLHQFGAGGGVSGVLILAESHITIHTWPEHSYAALDIFVCGECDLSLAVDLLADRLRPERIERMHCLRGRLFQSVQGLEHRQ